MATHNRDGPVLTIDHKNLLSKKIKNLLEFSIIFHIFTSLIIFYLLVFRDYLLILIKRFWYYSVRRVPASAGVSRHLIILSVFISYLAKYE
jgi:hypothetical protein